MFHSAVHRYAKGLWLIIKSAVAGAMIWFLIHQGLLDFTLILQGAIALNVVMVGLVLNLAMISLGAVRWHILLLSQDIVLPFAWSHRMIYLTMCFNMLVPGAVGGDALRLAYVARKVPDVQKGSAILTIFVDRFIGLYTLFVLALLPLLFNLPALYPLLPIRLLIFSLALVVGGGPLFILLLFWGAHRIPLLHNRKGAGKMGAVIDPIIRAVRLFRQSKGRLIAALLVSALAQTLEIISLLCIAYSLGMLTVPASHFFVAAPIAWVANILPISPGGLGVGEAAFSQMFQWLQPSSTVTAFGTVFLVNRIVQIGATLPGLWVYLTYQHDA